VNGGLFLRKTRHSSTYEWQVFLAGNPTNHQIMNGRGFFPGKPAIHRLMNGGFFA